MGLLEIVLVIVLLVVLFGGGYGYQHRADYGRGPVSIAGLLVVILIIVLIFRLL